MGPLEGVSTFAWSARAVYVDRGRLPRVITHEGKQCRDLKASTVTTLRKRSSRAGWFR